METTLYEQLKLVNNIYAHSIEEKQSGLIGRLIPIINTAAMPNIKTALYPHQLRSVIGMAVHHYQMTHGLFVDDQLLSGKLGILADSPGSGKTYTILAYLGLLRNANLNREIRTALGMEYSNQTIHRGELNTHSNRFFSSHHLINSTDLSSVNVVIVPPHLLNHWQQEIQRHTSLQPFIVDKPRILRNRTTVDGVLNSSFVLTTSRFYKELYELSTQHQIRWDNLFIDEATSIVLPADKGPPQFQFLWLITNQWLNLMFRNQYIFPHNLNHIRDRFALHPDCASWLADIVEHEVQINAGLDSGPFYRNIIPWTHPSRYAMVLRNRNTIHYPSVHELSYECAASYTLANLPQSIIGNHYAGLTHEKIPKLFRSLGLATYTQEMILAHYPEKRELIEGKWNDECSICLEGTQQKTLLPCCMNMFCGACILRQILTQTHSQCPNCRTHLYLPSLLPIRDLSGNEEVELMTKQAQTLTYILNRKDKSHIIYTPFENTYYQLYMDLMAGGVSCERLDSHVPKNNRTFANFQNGTVKVLFVSNVDLIRGIELTKASSLIFFFDPPSYEKEQMLVHSVLRLGQQQSHLTVVRLKSSL